MIKKLLPILVVCLIGCSYLYAQNFTSKYGKVTKDELEMASYAPDTSANAVVLYKNRTVRYDYVADEFQINYNYEHKIKILNSDGTDQANVSIPFYNPESLSDGPRDVVTRLEAYAYNLEGGKVVKTKMEKSYIFEERLSPYYEQIKFAIPAVKAGTVIEYRYQVTTKRFFQLDNWEIQQEIPVVYAYCEMSIPEYYRFNLNTQAMNLLRLTTEQKVKRLT